MQRPDLSHTVWFAPYLHSCCLTDHYKHYKETKCLDSLLQLSKHFLLSIMLWLKLRKNELYVGYSGVSRFGWNGASSPENYWLPLEEAAIRKHLRYYYRTRAGSVEVLLVDLLICCMFPTCYYKIFAEIPYNIRGNRHLRNFCTL